MTPSPSFVCLSRLFFDVLRDGAQFWRPGRLVGGWFKVLPDGQKLCSLGRYPGGCRTGRTPIRQGVCPLQDQACPLPPRLLARELVQCEGQFVVKEDSDGLGEAFVLAEDGVAALFHLHLLRFVSVDPDEEARVERVADAVGDPVGTVLRQTEVLRARLEAGHADRQLHVDGNVRVAEVVVPENEGWSVDASLATHERRQNVAQVLDLVRGVTLRYVQRLAPCLEHGPTISITPCSLSLMIYEAPDAKT